MLEQYVTSDPVVAAYLFKNATLILIIGIGIVIVKGFALWKAARLKEKGWFWLMIILNTAGILPIIYLVIKRKKR